MRFDTTGRPYNAEPGTPESFMSLGEAFIRSALARGASAPLWEVQTAKMQTDAGDPKAGLTEEARAGRDGQLAAPITGDTQTFRPVALDLDGDGIETIGKAASGVNFDVDDSGYLKHTDWLAGDDAFLVLDRNYNGSADSGRELFSNSTVALGKRGLAGMAWVDGNYDGKITATDPVWNELRVWRDADADGQQDAGETKTLAELGISELNYAMATYQANGQTRQLASPDLEADKDGTRINVVPEGILIQNSNGGSLSLLVTRIDDKTALEANRDGITSYEDVETIVSGADLLANDRLGGFLGRDLSIAGLTNFRHGTGFIDSNGLVHFTPEANYAGDGAGFDYIVRAANGQTGTAGVDITLQNVNDAPTAADQRVYKPIYGYTPTQTSTDDSGRSITTGGDPIYQPYALRQSFFGAGTIIYDPAPGQPSLEYHTTPVAYEDTGDGQIAGSDVDDPANSLTYQVVGTPQYGEVTLDAAGNYDYTSWLRPGQPSADVPTQCYAGAIRPGTDAFQVKVSDPHGASTLLTVTVPHPDPYFPPPPPSSGGGGCCQVAVDLDRNGFSFTPAEDSGVFFDINADGWKRQASWTKPGDGWLAYDANGNGAVDDGSEIVFSRYARTAQGDLQSLAEAFDTDHDSRLTAVDADINAIGNDLANVLTGNSGRNVLDGEAGADTMAAGAGDDTYVVDNAADTVTENDNEGVDTIRASVSYTLSDNVENLTLIGNADIDGKGNGLANVLSGNTGANLLDGGLGMDAMAGGAGNDTYIVDNSGDSITELVDEGADSIFSSVSYVTPANVENLTLTGSADIDATGNDLDNVLVGNTGGNIVDGGGGADTMKGGRGGDTYRVDNASGTVWEAAGEGIDNIYTSVSYVLPENVENLYLVGDGAINGGGNGADNLLIGNGANNVLNGGGGHDTLDGSAGDDRLDGGLGNDILIGSLGRDGLEGGEGDDTYLINQGDGLDRINDVAGTDAVRFGAGLSLDNVALRVTQENGAYTAHVRVLGAAGCEQADQGFDFAVTKDSSGHYVTPIENFQFADGSIKTFDDLLIKTNIVRGSAQTTTIVTGRNDDIIYVGPMSNIVRAGSGHDIVYVGPGSDTVFGEGGDDYIQSSTGDDTQDGGCGTDILVGADGRDLLRDPGGNNAFLAGFQDDRIEAGAGSDFIAGGKHDDTISAGGGANVIAFNRNDGRDTILPGAGASNTLSVGGGIMAGDLSFGRSGQDLMLNTGNGNFITFKDWYTGEGNRNFVTLQIIDDDPNRGPGGLFGHRVEAFDFRALVNKFDAAMPQARATPLCRPGR